jgi:hypothetical protein
VYVAEDNQARSKGEVLQYDADGNLLSTFIPQGTAGVGFIDAIRFGPNGDLYVTDLTNRQILEFNGQDGSFVRVFVSTGSGGLVNPAGLLFYDDGTSPTTSVVQGHDALPDPSLGSASMAARHSDPVLTPLNSVDGAGNQPITESLVVGDAPVSRLDSATTPAGALRHRAVDQLAEDESPNVSLIGLDVSDLR